MKKLLLLFVLLFFVGCGKPIYTQIIDESLISNRPIVANVTMDEFGVVDIQKDLKSPLDIKVQTIMAACSTQRSRSLGSDFDGYILIEIRKDGVLLAKSQMDFKLEPSRDEYKKVWEKLVQELRW